MQPLKIGFKIDIFLISLLILLITLLIWQNNLTLFFEGDSYDYFYPLATIEEIHQKIPSFTSFHYDYAAYVIYSFCMWFFKDNLYFYRVVQLLILGMLVVSFYFLLTTTTKSKIIGFLGAILAITNFNGLYEMLSARYFAHFSQRIPPIIFIFISLSFLYKYFEENRKIYLIISFILFFFAIALGQFGSMLLPLVLSFVICLSYLGSTHQSLIRKTTNAFFISLIFISINYFVVSHGYGQGSAQFNISNFLNSQNRPVEKVLYQIPNLALPLELMMFIRKTFFPQIDNWHIQIFQYSTPIFLFIYLSGILIVQKLNRKLLPIYLALLLGIIGHMFFYALIDERLNMVKFYGPSRQFFAASFIQSAIWAILIGVFLQRNKHIYQKIILSILLLLFILFNINKIWVYTDQNKEETQDSINFIAFYKNKSFEFDNNTIILAPAKLNWMSPFVYTFYSPQGLTFNLASDGWEKSYWGKKDNVFVFDYDYKNNKVLDFTDDYRHGKIVKLLN